MHRAETLKWSVCSRIGGLGKLQRSRTQTITSSCHWGWSTLLRRCLWTGYLWIRMIGFRTLKLQFLPMGAFYSNQIKAEKKMPISNSYFTKRCNYSLLPSYRPRNRMAFASGTGIARRQNSAFARIKVSCNTAWNLCPTTSGRLLSIVLKSCWFHVHQKWKVCSILSTYIR